MSEQTTTEGPDDSACGGWTRQQYRDLRRAVFTGEAYQDERRDLSYAQGVDELRRLEAARPWWVER